MNAQSWKHSAPLRLDDRERDEQTKIITLYRKLGCKIYVLSQQRPSQQTAGLPDLLVKHGGRRLSWTHEVKSPEKMTRRDMRMSSAQKDFADLCLACGDLHLVGGYQVGVDFLKLHGLIAPEWTG